MDIDNNVWDIFISHASEEKEEIAIPLVKLLEEKGLKVWIDRQELSLGDNLRKKINQGLKNSKFGVVILSPSFFKKRWTNHEFDALFQKEIMHGKTILPVWHKVSYKDVEDFDFGISGKLAIDTAEGLDNVAQAIISVFEKENSKLNNKKTGKKVRIKEEKTDSNQIIRGIIFLILIALLIISTISLMDNNKKKSEKEVPNVNQIKALEVTIKETNYRPEMLTVPKGNFLMGSPNSEKGRIYDESRHGIKISQPFLLSSTPITQSQYFSIMKDNPVEHRTSTDFKNKCSEFGIGDDKPIYCISWYECIKYCNKLSALENLDLAYNIIDSDSVHWNKSANGYRLPTEAEWEYAARAGSKGRYTDGVKMKDLEQYITYKKNSGKEVSIVKSNKPNPWGFYDMLGNVWEWVWDYHAPLSSSNETDPTGPSSSHYRVWKGGGFYSEPNDIRFATRHHELPKNIAADTGFRIAKNSDID